MRRPPYFTTYPTTLLLSRLTAPGVGQYGAIGDLIPSTLFSPTEADRVSRSTLSVKNPNSCSSVLVLYQPCLVAYPLLFFAAHILCLQKPLLALPRFKLDSGPLHTLQV